MALTRVTLARIERRQRAPQDVELVLLERRFMKDAPELELDLLLVGRMQELGLREQPLEVLMEALELGSRREPAVADGALGLRPVRSRHAQLVTEHLHR